jgi:hypothetical protein
MSDYHHKHTGINPNDVPSRAEDTSIADVIKHFRKDLGGKVLTMHFCAGDLDDFVSQSRVNVGDVTDDGIVTLLTKDRLDKMAFHQFDGNRTNFHWPLYETNDFWFPDDFDDRVWWGISDKGIEPDYLALKKEN